MSHDEDDYLWDKSGKPDPDLARIEASLSQLKYRPREHAAPVAKPRRLVAAGLRPRIAMAASVVLIGGVALYSYSRSRVTPLAGELQLSVISLEGNLQAGTSLVRGGAAPVALGSGESVVTGAASRARIELANGIGSIDMNPHTEVRVEELADHTQRLSLAQGSISARVIAVPRLFIVDTPSAQAVDLGCAYTLAVDSSGNAHLAVTSGRVELVDGGRRSVVPAGASCDTREGFGPGTPYWKDATPALRAALTRADFDMGGAAAIGDVVRAASPNDALTLVHLLPRATPADLPALYAKLAAIAPPPDGVTQNAILTRQKWAQEAWFEDVVNSSGVPDWGKGDPKNFFPNKKPLP